MAALVQQLIKRTHAFLKADLSKAEEQRLFQSLSLVDTLVKSVGVLLLYAVLYHSQISLKYQN